MKKTFMFFLTVLFSFSLTVQAVDYSTGEFGPREIQQRQEIQLPADFNIETANQEMLQARESGDIERANFLSLQINTHWKQNRVETFDPATQGTGENTGNGSILYKRENEENSNNTPAIPYWFDDVRIDPRDGIRSSSMACLSNGEIYTISQYYDSEWNGLIRRSVDGGQNWTTYWDYSYTGYTLTSPRIIECHDTLIISYILENSSNEFQAWTITALPGATYDPVFWGSPTGGFIEPTIVDYMVCTDGANYPTGLAYVYATWSEKWGPGSSYDSTNVMFARSNNIDISSWAIGPDIIYGSGGSGVNNIYFDQTRIANGDGMRLWIVSRLHPNLYGTSFDEQIRGWYSVGGSSWDSYVQITSYSNGIDEFQPSIAGSHDDSSYWVCLVTCEDTAGSDKDIYNYYSTDNGNTWTASAWINTSVDNFLSDVYVDNNSTAFFGTFRKDLSSTEEVRYKRGDISNPTSWTTSTPINDDDLNLSNAYGPSIAYNYTRNTAIIAWTNYNTGIYSIWFDDEGWSVGIEEETPTEISNTEIMNIVGNPCHTNINLRYTITTPGRVQITLRDVSGRTISELLNTHRGTGSYELNVEPEISSGVYYISINSADGNNTKQLMFVQ